MQHVTYSSDEAFAPADLNFAIFNSDRGQVEMMPPTLADQMAGQVVFVQALHHHHDGPVLLIVET